MTRYEANQILGVDNNVTPEDLKKICKDKLFEYHPDKNPDDPKASENFRIVKEAYDFLEANPYDKKKETSASVVEIISKVGEPRFTPLFDLCFGDAGKAVQDSLNVFANTIKNKEQDSENVVLKGTEQIIKKASKLWKKRNMSK